MMYARLDDLARIAADPGTRRRLLRLLAAVLPAPLLAGDPTAAAPKRRPACRKVGKPCSARRRCCAGARCRRRVCRCKPGRKPCHGACIPRRRACRRRPDEPDGCPPNQRCCRPGTEPCNGTCVPLGACCPGTDCVGECLTGRCVNGACELEQPGTPCGDEGARRCNSRGVCAQICGTTGDCPAPEPTTPAEFCRVVTCIDSICDSVPKPDHTYVPLNLQPAGDCEVLWCVHTVISARGVGVGIDSVASLEDAPIHQNPCKESYCADASLIAERDRGVGDDCSPDGGIPDGTMICNERLECVPKS